MVVTFLKCGDCGDFALALVSDGPWERPVCMSCLERGDREGADRRYVCSRTGCGNQPVYLASVEEGEGGSLLLCEKHFREVSNSIRSYLEVPRWLTNDRDFVIDAEGVVFEFDLDPGGG